MSEFTAVSVASRLTRREVIMASGIAVAAMALPNQSHATTHFSTHPSENHVMSFVKVSDGTEIYYKD